MTRLRGCCSAKQSRIQEDPCHLHFLVMSDEATFHVDGMVNTQNCRYWLCRNPRWVREREVKSPKVTVWCGMWREGIVGPFFFEGSVTGSNYLRMLEEQFLPVLISLHMQQEVCIFMQDGAPPHWVRTVRRWLDAHFPGRWMGRGSPNMPWPPRSPDLTICDFFLWGYVKSLVCRTPVSTIPALKDCADEAVCMVTDDMHRRVFAEYQTRLQVCLKLQGHHIEHPSASHGHK